MGDRDHPTTIIPNNGKLHNNTFEKYIYMDDAIDIPLFVPDQNGELKLFFRDSKGNEVFDNPSENADRPEDLHNYIDGYNSEVSIIISEDYAEAWRKYLSVNPIPSTILYNYVYNARVYIPYAPVYAKPDIIDGYVATHMPIGFIGVRRALCKEFGFEEPAPQAVAMDTIASMEPPSINQQTLANYVLKNVAKDFHEKELRDVSRYLGIPVSELKKK